MEFIREKVMLFRGMRIRTLLETFTPWKKPVRTISINLLIFVV